MFKLRPDQFSVSKHGFFFKFLGLVGRKKKQNKKKLFARERKLCFLRIYKYVKEALGL